MFVNKHFKYLARAYLRKYKGYGEILSEHYIYVKTKMLADFQICISVPKWLKILKMIILHKCEHPSLPTSLIKQNKNNWARNYM